VFSFVMKAENLEFADALQRLAQQSGVPLPSRERQSQQQGVERANEAARSFFQELLSSPQGSEARDYLRRRGLDAGAIEAFELGLSPRDGGSLRRHLVDRGYAMQDLAQAGLVHVPDNGTARDLFRGRLMFPIRNDRGDLVGFGGRALGDYNPKYLNSPRTSVFDKSRLLYGLHLAKGEAAGKGLVVVEGYMDVIAAHQHGFPNVVASMGTALTEHQVAAIRRLTSDVTMALDPDAAGQQATLRSLESSWQALHSTMVGRSRGITTFQSAGALQPKIAVLPPGQDPDQLIRNSPEEWTSIIENTTPIFDFVLSAVSAQLDPSTSQGKARIAEYVSSLVFRADPAEQDQYFQTLAAHLGVTPDTLRATLSRPSPQRAGRKAPPQDRGTTPSPFAKLDRDPLEDYCLAMLLQYSELDEAAQSLRPEYFQRLENREIFSRWRRDDGEHGSSVESLRAEIDAELAGHLETLIGKGLPPLSPRSRLGAVRDAVRRLEERHLRELKREEEIRFTEAPADWQEETPTNLLEINERLRQNQEKRGSLISDISNRG
jgi:DNA primase